VPTSIQEALKNELEELEREELDERLINAESAPIHTPAVPGKIATRMYSYRCTYSCALTPFVPQRWQSRPRKTKRNGSCGSCKHSWQCKCHRLPIPFLFAWRRTLRLNLSVYQHLPINQLSVHIQKVILKSENSAVKSFHVTIVTFPGCFA
jgi:hypothetical protein